MEETTHLPQVASVGPGAPLRWLARGWQDFNRARLPCLVYGTWLAGLSAGIALALWLTGALTWFFVLAGGFFLVAPMLAMGAYQAARMLEAGRVPGLADMFVVRSALRRDILFLGVALFVLFGIWVEAAYLVYGLSTRTMHKSVPDFLAFMLTTPDGHQMALVGSLVGGVIAWLAFSLVVISAPMMLSGRWDVFMATITSVRAVARNPLAMLVWAMLITGLTAIGLATACLGLIVIFPWIGLASWHAYRDLVPRPVSG